MLIRAFESTSQIKKNSRGSHDLGGSTTNIWWFHGSIKERSASLTSEKFDVCLRFQFWNAERCFRIMRILS